MNASRHHGDAGRRSIIFCRGLLEADVGTAEQHAAPPPPSPPDCRRRETIRPSCNAFRSGRPMIGAAEAAVRLIDRRFVGADLGDVRRIRRSRLSRLPAEFRGDGAIRRGRESWCNMVPPSSDRRPSVVFCFPCADEASGSSCRRSGRSRDSVRILVYSTKV